MLRNDLNLSVYKINFNVKTNRTNRLRSISWELVRSFVNYGNFTPNVIILLLYFIIRQSVITLVVFLVLFLYESLKLLEFYVRKMCWWNICIFCNRSILVNFNTVNIHSIPWLTLNFVYFHFLGTTLYSSYDYYYPNVGSTFH